MRIIGIKINEGYPAVIKNLKPGGWYPFGDYNEPTENNKWIWEKDNDDELLSSIYKYATDESFPDGLRISVSCIVGQNGSGKTTLLELMFRIINNFAYTVLDKKKYQKENELHVPVGRRLLEATGFAASLFFETDGNLGKIAYNYGNISYYYLSGKNHSMVKEDFKSDYISDSKRKKILSSFFYTICTNYSIHSFCQADYVTETLMNPLGELGIDGKWVRGLLHKNDGYLTPLVVVPYRDDWGNINISNEKDLAEQRLATLSLLFWSQGKCFMDKYKPVYIEYRFDDTCSIRYYNKMKKLCNDKLFLDEKEVKKLHDNFCKVWNRKLEGFVPFKEYAQPIKETILTYLVYKSIKICLNYPSFGQMIGIRIWTESEKEYLKELYGSSYTLTGGENRTMRFIEDNETNIENVINKILSVQEYTHITLKIHQVLEFLKRKIYDPIYAPIGTAEYLTSVKKISAEEIIKRNLKINNSLLPENKQRKRFHTYDEVFSVLPPSIFEWKMYFLPKGEKISQDMNNGMPLGKMSSGEKQILQSASYILYHIKNIESIREDSYRKAYHHINLVLDEAELYFHPEMQRTMIANIIKMLSWCHINNTKIRSVNIIIVTHSPFVLSDVPKNRILYLKDGKTENKDNQTFASNIHDLLYNQFFIQNPIGEVALASVKQIVDMYDVTNNVPQKVKDVFFSKIEYYSKVVNLIGENYLRNTLMGMLDTIMLRNNNKRILEEEKRRLILRVSEIEKLLKS